MTNPLQYPATAEIAGFAPGVVPPSTAGLLPAIETLGLDHLGIAVRELVESRRFYESMLGATCVGIEEVAEQQVRVAFIQLGREQPLMIELLEPTCDTSPIAKFLEKRGPGVHHIALAVRDLPLQLAKLKLQQVRLIDATPRRGAHGKSIAFVHPQPTGGVLLELCETLSPEVA
ncbi:MAG: methylmalonyl-CoA epimerase [Planctomycetaceae bacterium]|nr:methylmalonyl-CoA epimerase [Planctomycetaceae bacterium]